MVHPIVKYGDPVLNKVAEPITAYNKELQKLVADMFESMYAAKGVGLAAPQIGISKHIAVIDISFGKDPEQKLVLCNPIIIAKEGKQSEEEGCLSVPEFREKVTRPLKATVRANDAKGHEFTMTGEGLLARAFCHETDHLNGKLYLSYLSSLKRELIVRKIKKLEKAGEWA
jgi:peptide deformylase